MAKVISSFILCNPFEYWFFLAFWFLVLANVNFFVAKCLRLEFPLSLIQFILFWRVKINVFYRITKAFFCVQTQYTAIIFPFTHKSSLASCDCASQAHTFLWSSSIAFKVFEYDFWGASFLVGVRCLFVVLVLPIFWFYLGKQIRLNIFIKFINFVDERGMEVLWILNTVDFRTSFNLKNSSVCKSRLWSSSILFIFVGRL